MTESLKVNVWRGRSAGRSPAYDVPRSASQTVLDVVTHIQRRIDPTLAYRFACRVGMCGSCAMSVNGVARWTCRTHVARVAKDGVLEIAPLANLPVIKDLVTDMREFFDKWAKAKGQFKGTKTRRDDFARIAPQSPERVAADAGIECIGCGVCYASCDVVGWRPGVSRPGGAQPRVDARQRPARRRATRAPARRRRRRRLPLVPHAGLVQRALSEAHRADGRHRRIEAARREGCAARRAVSERPDTGAAVVRATRERDGAGSVRRRASRWNDLCGARRAHRRGDPRTDARELGVRRVLHGVRRGLRDPRADRRRQHRRRDDGRARVVRPLAIASVLALAILVTGIARRLRGGGVMMRTIDYRARMHPGYWAFVVHRVSGLALAVFLPVHFWALGLALQRRGGARRFSPVHRQRGVQARRMGARDASRRAPDGRRAGAAHRVRAVVGPAQEPDCAGDGLRGCRRPRVRAGADRVGCEDNMQVDLDKVEDAARELYVRALKILPPDIKAGFDRLRGDARPTRTARRARHDDHQHRGGRAHRQPAVPGHRRADLQRRRSAAASTSTATRLKQAMRRGCARATREHPLRSSIVHPITRDERAHVVRHRRAGDPHRLSDDARRACRSR